MRNIVLSVIVPIYNGEKYLDRLIEAFLMQKLDQFEVILIDDGSVDGTYQICKNYSKTYSWIRVLHTENKGVSHARNLGIKEAKGKWIHFIDVDDVIHPELFREFYEISNSEETEIIICGCIREEIETGKKFIVDQKKIR